MPIYEYQCNDCGRKEEVLQKISDSPLTKCPNCSGRLQKLISQSTFHLKGSGWYVTDYAGGSKSDSSPGEKENKEEKKTKKVAKTEPSKSND